MPIQSTIKYLLEIMQIVKITTNLLKTLLQTFKTGEENVKTSIRRVGIRFLLNKQVVRTSSKVDDYTTVATAFIYKRYRPMSQ